MNGNRGMAQLLVLWTLMLLGTLAAGFALSMRAEAHAARNGIDSLRAYYQARTGISMAITLLSTIPVDDLSGVLIEGEEEDAAYRVEIVGEGGKVNINLVSEEDLLYILKRGGLSGEKAESVCDAILDWRDADDEPRPNGAESSEYARLREPLFPRNGGLASIEELRCVMGVKQEFYDRFLSRVFTVHGSGSQVIAYEASRTVLASLPGVSSEAVAEIMARQSEGSKISSSDLAGMMSRGLLTQRGVLMLSGRSPSQVYEITATGRAGQGMVHTVRCLASVDGRGRGNNSAKILRWVDLVTREEV
ncbi:MAG: general secretion pathway protein GspK [Syntrophorhabdaceae bacterium]|nr:general secretion pathway protein GspK [Syntrophorhabdaceae bacterium]